MWSNSHELCFEEQCIQEAYMYLYYYKQTTQKHKLDI